MFRNDLLSKEWCNLIFEGKNKDYGAYRLRATAGKRYRYALIIVLTGTLLLAAIPMVMTAYIAHQMKMAADEITRFAKLHPIDLEEEKEIKIIAAGRNKPHAQSPNAVTDASPEIVDGTPPELSFEKRGPETIIAEKNNEVPLKSDSLHNDDQKDLPVEGKLLTPTQVVDEMPRFPGGIEALVRFLDTHISYPKSAIDNHVNGQVEVSFLIDIKGEVKDITITKHLTNDCDKAVLDACKKLPRWQPGKTDGKLTMVKMTIPINFNVQ